MSEPTPYIFDVTTANFDQAVIQNSFEKPVLVDFWAEWCAPCKALMPMLAKIAESYQGELLLAKIDCEAEQDIVARFGIQSLPTVVLFKDGQPVDGFAGAQPESAVRAMLEPHVQMPPPAAADPFEHAQALFDDSRFADAEAALKVQLGEAQTVLDAVKSDEHKAALAGAKAQIQFLGQAKDLPDAADLKARLAKNPQDDEAVYQLAIQQLARQQYDAALDALLKLFIRNRSYSEGLPHKTLLQVFELLGNDHPLVTTYRRKLFAALY